MERYCKRVFFLIKYNVMFQNSQENPNSIAETSNAVVDDTGLQVQYMFYVGSSRLNGCDLFENLFLCCLLHEKAIKANCPFFINTVVSANDENALTYTLF